MGGNMRNILVCLCAMFVVSACDMYEFNLQCDSHDVGINLSGDGEHLDVNLDGTKMTLDLAISASGVRYVGTLDGTDVTLWNKGSDWMLFFDDGMPIYCTVK